MNIVSLGSGTAQDFLKREFSARYKAIQDYLIPDAKWENKKHALLEKADLMEFMDVDKVLSNYKDKLSSLYDTVNRRHQKGL